MTLDMTTALVSNQLSSVTQKLESGLGISDDDDKARVSDYTLVEIEILREI